jgi:CHAT domain-containing protein
LLGQLTEADEEQVELCLLADPDYSEEFAIIESELTDQYVEGILPDDERIQFEQYFLRAPEREDKLAFAMSLREAVHERTLDVPASSKKIRAPWYSYAPVYLKAAAVIIIVMGMGVGVWLLLVRRSDEERALADLRAAYKNQRLIEARITKLDYAPLAITRGQEKPNIDEVSLRRAELQLLKDLNENPDAKAHHALGRFYLAGSQLDKAIEQLEIAVKQEPNDAQSHSDLGAALLEKGKAELSSQKSGKSLEYFAKGLEEINKANELDGSLLEAFYNRAVVHQYMMLPQQAEDDWHKYLERDNTSKWADEARQQLKTLEEQQKKTSRNEEQSIRDFLSAYELRDDNRSLEIVSQNYTSTGNVITDVLIDSYLGLKSKGEDDNASSKLRALAYAGQLEFQRSGDVYISELARFYGESNPQQRHNLARAREQMREGYKLFLNSKVDDALSSYAQAKQAFEESGDECEANFAKYRMGHSYWLKPDLKKSSEIFAQLLSTCAQKNYKWLLSQSLYRTASIRLTYNEYSESIDYAHRALKQLEQIQDTIGTLNILIMLADEYRSLQNEGQSLNFLQRALILASGGIADPPQTWGIFTAIALNFNSLGLHGAALEYQKEALRLALEMDRPLLISRSYDYLGLTYGDLKIYADALRNINLAFEVGSKLSGARPGLEMMANSSLHAGEVYRQMGDYDKAVESYERSIQLYNELEYPYFTYPAHKGKLLAFIAKGDDSATEEELHSVLGLFEQYRSKLTNESQRNTFFDVEQRIYDLAIDFADTKKQNPQQAFEYSELSRARSLLDAMRQSIQVSEQEDGPELHLPATSTPLTLTDIQQQMPTQAQIIQYAVLDDKLLIWVVDRTSITLKETPMDSRALGDKVLAYLRKVNSPSTSIDAETDEDAKELYSILIMPIEPLLDKTKLLCIVPDKLLNYVPFGALISTATNRYLVQDFRLELAPSSTVFIDCSEQARRKTAGSEEKLLSVGNPSFDRDAFPSLPRLPSGGREAEAITAFYKSSRLLLGNDAHERVVRSEIEKSDVAHFALHYLVDDRSNLLSKIVLASERSGETSDKSEDGVWQSYEIYKMKLPHTRLVILSACQTGIEQQYRGEGAISVARPFIVAGVPLIVASLWPVDSMSTERLMVSFHRHRTRGHLSSAEALRHAQLELLGGDDTRYRRPYYWAAFTAIGGYAEY